MTDKKGFTLIELLVTIAMAAIVATIGIPSFSQSIRNSRLTTNANELLTSLNLARSEAIKQGIQVTMRRKPSSVATQWEKGWDVFIDINADEAFNDDGDTALCETTATGSPNEDCLLKQSSELPTGFTLRTGNSTYKDYIAFKSSGLSTVSVGDTFRLCDGSANTTVSRAISINSVGRARVSTGTVSCP